MYACCDKPFVFVATKILTRKAYFCRDKKTFLSRKTFCICRDNFFVEASILSSQQKTCFVATKMILVVAPTNDSLHCPINPHRVTETPTFVSFSLDCELVVVLVLLCVALLYLLFCLFVVVFVLHISSANYLPCVLILVVWESAFLVCCVAIVKRLFLS